MIDQTGSQAEIKVLVLDDEDSILNAIKRLLRRQPYQSFFTNDCDQAFQLIESENIAIILSDMRMPKMDGAAFFRQVKQRWPQTIRILMTGYASMQATIAAINDGKIFRYICKPWQDDEILYAIEQAIEQYQLISERDRLYELSKKQNEKLTELNQNLEQKVFEKTQELLTSYKKLKLTHRLSLKVLSQLLTLRETAAKAYSHRVALLAEFIGTNLSFFDGDAEQLYYAGLLHDIGKLALPDNLANLPFESLSEAQHREYKRHPLIGQSALLAIRDLRETGRYIRHQHEYWNGQGYPDGLTGERIPLGARILAIARDYEDQVTGISSKIPLNDDGAQAFLHHHKGTRYDPDLVEICQTLIPEFYQCNQMQNDTLMRLDDLKAGMVLSKDLYTEYGMLLQIAGFALDQQDIASLHDYQRQHQHEFFAHVQTQEHIRH